MRGARDSVEPKLTFSAKAGGNAVTRKVDFFGLPRAVQERFVASCRRGAHPVPIVFVRAPRTRVLVWVGAGLALALAAFVLARVGMGNVESALALQDVRMLAVYGALFAASAFAFVRAIANAWEARALPAPPGTYVFPAVIVDARSHAMRVHALRDMAGVERSAARPNVLNFTLADGSRLSVEAANLDEAQRAEQELTIAKTELARALEDDNPRAMALLDPLYDGAVSSPLGPQEPMRREIPVWARFGWAIALVVAAGFGPLLWLMRNRASDESMYKTVTAEQTIAGYKAYLARGGRHSGEIADILLPRAELAEATKAGTVEAILAFGKAHPNCKIQPEVDEQIRKALLVELEKAKSQKTVMALKDFASRYPMFQQQKLGKDYGQAMHALYASALDGYKQQAPEKDLVGAGALFERLLAFCEKNGPNVELRFRSRDSKSLAKADEAIGKNSHFLGADTLPSRFFADDKMKPREDDLAQTIVDRFNSAFPPDVAKMKVGADLPDGDLPKLTAPTLVIDYAVEWSRTQAYTQRPRGLFAGINMPFEVSFHVPDGKPPMKVSFTSWRTPDAWGLRDQANGAPGDFAAAVYAQMTNASFDLAKKRSVEALFRKR